MKYYVVYTKCSNETITDIVGQIIVFKGTKSEMVKSYIKENKIILNIIKLDE